MKPKLRHLALALAIHSSVVIPHSSFAQSASPALIPFQGRLTDQQGAAYQTGQFTITFNLYDQAIGGTTVWTERHEKVSVINGMINAFLGSVNSIDSVNFSTTKYLGIAVDADANAATPEPEMVPRTMIVAAFHAKKAEVATNATQLNGAGWDAVLTNANPNAGGAVLKADKIADGIISDAKLAAGAVTADKLANGAVSADKLAAGSVTAAKIADGTITGQQIQNGSVANADLVAGTASANLADEGLIALSAAPINLREGVSASVSTSSSGFSGVYTVPANRYARVTIWWHRTGGGEITVDGRPISALGFGDATGHQELWMSSGQVVRIKGDGSQLSHAVVLGVLMSNGGGASP
jgi:hypothetical protein